jgi:HPt (histidine-containing phosphotransfer) domain-containing protein
MVTDINAAAGGEEIFDRAALERSCGGDADFRKLLVEVFVRQAEEQVAGIAAAVQSSDYDAALHGAHKLRSSSASIGACIVSRIAGDIEARCKAGHTVDLPTLATQLQAAYRQVRPRMDEFLPA